MSQGCNWYGGASRSHLNARKMAAQTEGEGASLFSSVAELPFVVCKVGKLLGNPGLLSYQLRYMNAPVIGSGRGRRLRLRWFGAALKG